MTGRKAPLLPDLCRQVLPLVAAWLQDVAISVAYRLLAASRQEVVTLRLRRACLRSVQLELEYEGTELRRMSSWRAGPPRGVEAP